MQSNLAPAGSIKRRRIDVSADKQDYSPSKGGASAFPQPTEAHAALMAGGLGGSDDSDGSEDEELGPRPTMQPRSENDIQGRLRDLEKIAIYMAQKTRTTKKAKKQLRVELDENSTHVAQLELEKGVLTTKVDTAEKQVQKLQSEKR
ncbi:hypothetical protein IWW35_005572, partial [Coemansia sp. RSA 1878]